MGLGDQKCNRHPRHMANECPHHGRPQEETCYCNPDAVVHEEVLRSMSVRPTPVLQFASTVMLDGVQFLVAVEGVFEPQKAQAAAARLKAVTVPIGAKWS